MRISKTTDLERRHTTMVMGDGVIIVNITDADGLSLRQLDLRGYFRYRLFILCIGVGNTPLRAQRDEEAP